VESIFDACQSNLLEKFQYSRAIVNGDDGLATVPEYESYQQLFLLVAQSMWSPACAAFLASPIWVCSLVPNDLVNAAERWSRAILLHQMFLHVLALELSKMHAPNNATCEGVQSGPGLRLLHLLPQRWHSKRQV
jgi:hypothetical protein